MPMARVRFYLSKLDLHSSTSLHLASNFSANSPNSISAEDSSSDLDRRPPFSMPSTIFLTNWQACKNTCIKKQATNCLSFGSYFFGVPALLPVRQQLFDDFPKVGLHRFEAFAQRLFVLQDFLQLFLDFFQGFSLRFWLFEPRTDE